MWFPVVSGCFGLQGKIMQGIDAKIFDGKDGSV